MSVYLEADDEPLFADDLQAALALVQARYNRGARSFFIRVEAGR